MNEDKARLIQEARKKIPKGRRTKPKKPANQWFQSATLDDPAIQELFLYALGQTGVLKRACKTINLSPQGYYQWLKNNPEFEIAVKRAMSSAAVTKSYHQVGMVKAEAMLKLKKRILDDRASDGTLLSVLKGELDPKQAQWYQQLPRLMKQFEELQGAALIAKMLEYQVELCVRGLLPLGTKELIAIHDTLKAEQLTAASIEMAIAMMLEFLEKTALFKGIEKANISRFIEAFQRQVVQMFSERLDRLPEAQRLAASLPTGDLRPPPPPPLPPMPGDDDYEGDPV